MTDAGPIRPRRLRRTAAVRDLVRDTSVTVTNLIYPVFVDATVAEPREIESMPGMFRWPVEEAAVHVAEAARLGIRGILLFGIPSDKDAAGSGADAEDGVVQRAIRLVRERSPGVAVFADLCLCEYTDHGHCGLLGPESESGEREILNDETLPRLVSIAISQARAGADFVAPSGMIDGAVQAIRRGLDEAGYSHVGILAYSVKFASAFYAPFRDAALGAPRFGDRTSHQMDPANGWDALREARLDANEGADMLMVKPALAYLDVVRQCRQEVPELPIVAYNVSGEYAMIRAAAARNWLDERRVVMEVLTGLRRAGAQLVVTYHAMDVARWLRAEEG